MFKEVMLARNPMMIRSSALLPCNLVLRLFSFLGSHALKVLADDAERMNAGGSTFAVPVMAMQLSRDKMKTNKEIVLGDWIMKF